MKGKLLDDPNFYPEVAMPCSMIRGKEYLILGYDSLNSLYIYDEEHKINIVPLDRVEITED